MKIWREKKWVDQTDHLFVHNENIGQLTHLPTKKERMMGVLALCFTEKWWKPALTGNEVFLKYLATDPSKCTLSFENMSHWLAYCPEIVPRLQGSHQSQDEIPSLGRTQSAGDLPAWLALATGTLATGLLYKEQCSVPVCCYPGWQDFFMMRSDVNTYRNRRSELEFGEHSDI